MAEVLRHFSKKIENIASTDESFDMIQAFKPEWSLPDVDVQTFINGLYSQSVSYTIEVGSDRPTYICYVYGSHHSTDGFPNIDCLKFLTRNRIDPEIVATFENGFIYTLYLESWILDCSKSLSLIEHCFTSRKMAQVHKVTYPVETHANEPKLWPTIDKYITYLPEVYKAEGAERNEFQTLVHNALNDITYLKSGLQYLPTSIVWSYANYQSINITYEEDNTTIRSVETQYIPTVEQAFDIANFFVTNLHPLKVSAERNYELCWLRAYLSELNESGGFSEHDVEILHVAVDFQAVVNALYSGLHALIQAISQPDDPTFMTRAVKKFEEYHDYRENHMFY